MIINIETMCPYCDDTFDSSICTCKEHSPTEGELYICPKCIEPSEFDEDLKLIKVDTTKLSMEDVECVDRYQCAVIERNREKRA